MMKISLRKKSYLYKEEEMLLNDIIVEDQLKMADTFKKSLVSAFGHLCPQDQKYIVNHMDKFIPRETKIYFPHINGHVPAFLVSLETKVMNSPEYAYGNYDITVEYPAAGSSDIVVANDMSKLYCLLWKENSDFAFINMICSLTFAHPKDLYAAFIALSSFITDRKLDPFIYPDTMTAVAIYYDAIATLTINSIGLRGSYMMQTQTRAFSYMAEMLNTKVPTKPIPYLQEILLLELNILTSLVPIEDVKRDIQYLKTADMANKTIGAFPNDHIYQVIQLVEKRSLTDPFVASKFETYRRPIIKGFSFVSDKKIRQTNNDLVELMENTTREKIKDLIEENTGVIEDIDNISFDIPETLLTMYQLEFSREHPIILVPIPLDNTMNRDGSDWRHVIHYENDILVAFYLKNAPTKLYAIHIYRYNDEDTKCTLVEFTGKENDTYEFVY